MAGVMRARATEKGGVTEIRVLMNHPMETGQRKDASGKIVPQHFIQNLTVTVNGRVVMEGQISQAVSRNPVFSFRVKGVNKGDKIGISWVDSSGDTNKTETAVA